MFGWVQPFYVFIADVGVLAMDFAGCLGRVQWLENSCTYQFVGTVSCCLFGCWMQQELIVLILIEKVTLKFALQYTIYNGLKGNRSGAP